IDAQRQEFYVASYEIGGRRYRELERLHLATMAEAERREKTEAMLIGPEVTKWFSRGRLVMPRAATVGRLALTRMEFIEPEKMEPSYLRETTFVKAPRARFGVES